MIHKYEETLRVLITHTELRTEKKSNASRRVVWNSLLTSLSSEELSEHRLNQQTKKQSTTAEKKQQVIAT